MWVTCKVARASLEFPLKRAGALFAAPKKCMQGARAGQIMGACLLLALSVGDSMILQDRHFFMAGEA